MKLRQVPGVYRNYQRAVQEFDMSATYAMKESVCDAFDRAEMLLMEERTLKYNIQCLSTAIRLCPGAVDLLKQAKSDYTANLLRVQAELNTEVDF